MAALRGGVQVLKLDVSKEAGGLTGIAAPTNLTMNQTLEGHRGACHDRRMQDEVAAARACS